MQPTRPMIGETLRRKSFPFPMQGRWEGEGGVDWKGLQGKKRGDERDERGDERDETGDETGDGDGNGRRERLKDIYIKIKNYF